MDHTLRPCSMHAGMLLRMIPVNQTLFLNGTGLGYYKPGIYYDREMIIFHLFYWKNPHPHNAKLPYSTELFISALCWENGLCRLRLAM